MKIWKWDAASDAYTTLLPVRDEDLLSGVFSTDGTSKSWSTRLKVKPAIERNEKKQLPLADISFVMGSSLVLNDKAHAVLADFLQLFGQFLDLDLMDESSPGGAERHLYFYNVTNMVECIDFARSEVEGKKILRPAFIESAVPSNAQVFKDPLRKKMDIYVNAAGYQEVSKRMTASGLRGSTLTIRAD